MKSMPYEVMQEGGAPIKSWTLGVPFEEEAKTQLKNIAQMPFIHKWVAAMPDVHLGKGATIGSVVPTLGAVIPAAVGVDIGCGMMAVRTSLTAAQLPDNLAGVRSAIERAVPHGRTGGFRGKRARDKGAWADTPDDVLAGWTPLASQFDVLQEQHPILKNTNNINHLGTLGTGNHFIEMCLDEQGSVWLMLHSGSRGVGNRIGTYFIEKAKRDMERWHIHLPDSDLAYFPEGTEHFKDYVQAVGWAQDFARINREVMMARTIGAVKQALGVEFEARREAVNCHHNYVSREHHYGKDVLVTRKGAVSARVDEMGIIPGSMGAKSFIVRGLGNEESFCSCSHGAGRVMSRTKAKKLVSLEEHRAATADVECRKDEGVIDETPSAYKPIEKVMAAQKDLVEIVYTLKQVVCVKG
ncbi:RtcB family protein [uncultured Microbulbifer sp.]|uniref:RtcB family protein n=1 Tax=uncultured Microbulbifer sp. TaxID=348147 RepID=UPI00261EF607|nr:RtcB family protein [uncultured Microbulbifer sp.]